MITPGRVFVYMLITPAVCFVSSMIPMISLITAPVAALVMAIVSGFIAYRLAKRLALTRAVQAAPHRSLDPKDRAFIGWTFSALLLLQLVLGAAAIFGGCMVAFSMISIH